MTNCGLSVFWVWIEKCFFAENVAASDDISDTLLGVTSKRGLARLPEVMHLYRSVEHEENRVNLIPASVELVILIQPHDF